jgi:hypothetical protein
VGSVYALIDIGHAPDASSMLNLLKLQTCLEDLRHGRELGLHADHSRYYGKVGLRDENFTFHNLWHTFATELFNQHKRPKFIQFLLGQSSITQTMVTYLRFMEGMGGDTVDGLDEAFGGQGSGRGRIALYERLRQIRSQGIHHLLYGLRNSL